MPITQEIAAEILQRQISEKIELEKLMPPFLQPTEVKKEKWMQTCRDNLKFITSVIQEHGWSAAHLFEDKEAGKVVEYAAFLCVQHGDASCMGVAPNHPIPTEFENAISK
jgi:hypothetical protein